MALALADARANNYALGVKLVRGAYHPHEIAAHRVAAAHDKAAGAITTPRSLSISPDVEPPVWMEKSETDEAYNACLKVLIKAVKEDVKRCEKAVGHPFVLKNTEVIKGSWFGLFSGSTDTKVNERAAKVDKIPKTTTTVLAPSIGVLFGTHNWNSCGLILKNLVDNGLAVADDGQDVKSVEVGELAGVIKISDEAVERIAIGQLYGTLFSNSIPNVHLLY